jgi:hypothetical protein
MKVHRSDISRQLQQLLHVVNLLWHLVSLMMAVRTLVETRCSKTLLNIRIALIDGCYPFFCD